MKEEHKKIIAELRKELVPYRLLFAGFIALFVDIVVPYHFYRNRLH